MNILKPTKFVHFKRVIFLQCELHPNFLKCSPLGEKKLGAWEPGKISQQLKETLQQVSREGRESEAAEALTLALRHPRPFTPASYSLGLQVPNPAGLAAWPLLLSLPSEAPVVYMSNARLFEPC